MTNLLNHTKVSYILFIIAAIFYLAFATIFVTPVTHQLDPSWVYALNIYDMHGLEFGKDLIFTYGPLGYILLPIPVGNNLLIGLTAAMIVHTWLVVVMAFYAWKSRDGVGPAIMLTLLLLFCRSFFIFPLYAISAGSIVCYLSYLKFGRGEWLWIIPAFFAAAMLFIKSNFGIYLSLTFFVFLTLCAFSRPMRRKTILAGMGFFAVAFCVLSIALFSSLQSLMTWLIGTWEICAGYSEAMSIVSPMYELAVVGVTLLIIGFVALLAARHLNGRLAVFWLLLALPALFFNFKAGFVRADGHIYLYFYYVPALLSTIMIFVRTKFILLGVLASSVICAWIPLERFPNLMILSPSTATANILKSLWNYTEFYADESTKLLNRLSVDNLTEQEVEQVASGTVSIVPTDTSHISAGSIKWRPEPVFQYYSAYTEWLDQYNSDHINSINAADFVIFKWQAIDGVHVLHQAPLSFLSIMNRYDFLSETDDRLILKRNGGPWFKKRFLASTMARNGERIPLPETNSIVVADINIQRTLMGSLIAFLLRFPPVYISLHSADEAVMRSRINPSLAQSGIVVSNIPQSLNDFRKIIESKTLDPKLDRYRNILLDIPSSWINYYEDDIEIDFYQLEVEGS